MRSTNRWVRCALLTIATIAATLGLSASASAAGWGPEFRIGTGTALNIGTHINEKGDVTFLAAEQVATEKMEVFARVESGDSPRITRRPIAKIKGVDPLYGENLYAESGQDAEGRVSLVWSGESGWESCGCGAPKTLYVTRLDERGAPLATPLTIADYTDDDPRFTSASYAVGADGRAIIGATVYNPTSDEAWIEIFEIDSDFSTVKKITPNGYGAGANLISVATNASGQTLAAWRTIDDDAGEATIAAQYFTANGPASAVTELFSADESEDPITGEIHLADDGSGVVAIGKGTLEQGVLVAMIGPDGSTLPPIALDEAVLQSLVTAFGLPEADRITALPDGSVLFTFLTTNEASEIGLKTFVVAKDGSVRSHEIVVPATLTEALVFDASLASRPDGSGAVIFSMVEEALVTDDPVAKLILQPLDKNGAPSGPRETLSEQMFDGLLGFHANPQLAMNSRGEIAAAWTALDLFGESMSASGRVFDAAAPVILIRSPAAALAGSETVLVATVADRNEATTTWSFGDGETATGEIQTHTFQNPGTYELRVQSTDSLGNVGTATKQIRVVADRSDEGATKRPDTRITHPPRLRLRVPRAVVRFTSDQEDATFECRIGRGPITGSRQARLRARGKGRRGLTVRGQWRKCASPLRLKRLRPAVYVVRVRAVGQNGARDRSPAVVRFRVLSRRHIQAVKKRTHQPKPARPQR